MIGPGTGVRVYLACGATDMRKGVEGLAVRLCLRRMCCARSRREVQSSRFEDDGAIV